MLYLGYLKHALVRAYCYPRAVILVKCGVLDYICHHKVTNKNTHQTMCHDDSLS